MLIRRICWYSRVHLHESEVKDTRQFNHLAGKMEFLYIAYTVQYSSNEKTSVKNTGAANRDGLA